MKHKKTKEPNLFCCAALAYARQWIKEMRTDAKAPEETPPNSCTVAKPVQAVPMKLPPWNEWLRLARQGDKRAIQLFCAQAEPFIDKLCNDMVFRSLLGKEETRSVASLLLMEFLMNYPTPPNDKELPFLLKFILRRRLLNRVKKQKVRNQHEQRPTTLLKAGALDTERDGLDTLPASEKTEPESSFLQKERRRAVLKAFQQLKPAEQEVIHAFFYQKKTPAAIAGALHCSRQYVEKVRNNALLHMRQYIGEAAV